MDVVEYSENYSVALSSAICNRENYCELASQCRSSVYCEARYTGAGPGRLHQRACGCGRERRSSRRPVVRRCARDTGSKLARDSVGKSVCSVG
jgi:hypothetical protein